MQGTRRVSGTMEGGAKTATRVEEADRRRATWMAAAQAGDRNAFERSLNRLRRQDLSAQANGGAANRFRGDQRREGYAVERRRGQRADRPILPVSTVRRSPSPSSTSRPAGHYRRAFCRSRSRTSSIATEESSLTGTSLQYMVDHYPVFRRRKRTADKECGC
jgi:hypothetical protein